ncbi:hypothetical protein HZH68_001848 [Vespula germanica]|uniref:Uncharacterized protein n=2 Tax=Vespula TaxID=7451 RepID=A0A834NLX9_VESGE|nr:hypothetical protein HZH68_001848 [Vespula germanica]
MEIVNSLTGNMPTSDVESELPFEIIDRLIDFRERLITFESKPMATFFEVQSRLSKRFVLARQSVPRGCKRSSGGDTNVVRWKQWLNASSHPSIKYESP